MSVGTNSIKRAAKTAAAEATNIAAAERKTANFDGAEEKPKTGRSKSRNGSAGKTDKKTQRKPGKNISKKAGTEPDATLTAKNAEDTENAETARNAETVKSSGGSYGIGQQLPVHLL